MSGVVCVQFRSRFDIFRRIARSYKRPLSSTGLLVSDYSFRRIVQRRKEKEKGQDGERRKSTSGIWRMEGGNQGINWQSSGGHEAVDPTAQ